jgi:DUF971 family protein
MQLDQPRLLRLNAADGTLEIDWPSGSTDALTYAVLRARCMCSQCRRMRQGRQQVEIVDGITVVEARPCGSNAVQLVFSDGHDRGIFPFAYLRELADKPAVDS